MDPLWSTFVKIFLLCLVIHLIAWKSGFYKKILPRENPIRLKYFFWIFGLYFLVQIVIFPILALFLFREKVGDSYQLVMNLQEKGWYLFTAMMTVFAITLVFSLSFGKKVTEYLWQGRARSFILGCITWLLVFPLAILISQAIKTVYIDLFQLPPYDMEQSAVRSLLDTKETPFLFYSTVAAIIIFVPIAEEIIFRGFLQPALNKMMPVHISIILTSFVFAFMHYTSEQGIGNIELLANLFMLSCFLGYIFERERSLWAPIGLHITFNALSILFLTLEFY